MQLQKFFTTNNLHYTVYRFRRGTEFSLQINLKSTAATHVAIYKYLQILRLRDLRAPLWRY